jgi:predicted transcriptional regulator
VDLSTETGGVSPEQAAKAVAARLSSRTDAEAAESLGVSVSTFRRWLKSDDAVEAMREACAGLLRDAVAASAGGLGVAMATMRELAENEQVAAQTRLQAANSIVNAFAKLSERCETVDKGMSNPFGLNF